MASTLLLGPPVIHSKPYSNANGIAEASPSDLMEVEISSTSDSSDSSSVSPCLDFFFRVVPDTPAATITSLLSSAWAHHPLTALKLVCNLRGVRGTGKNDREAFYTCALWLHRFHPATLALNVASLAEFGYMKDLLEILFRLLHGPDARKNAAAAAAQKKKLRKQRFSTFLLPHYNKEEKKKKKKPKVDTINDRILIELKKLNVGSSKSKKRVQRKADLAMRAVRSYSQDHRYQFLYDRVAEFFAKLLASDLEKVKSGNFGSISLAAKWCPSLDSSFDKSTLLCESIARLMFPKDSDPQYRGIEQAHYAYRVRTRLRKEVIVPLRRVLELPEAYMSSGKWDSIQYERVSSFAMSKCSSLFKKHDEKKFNEYVEKAKQGKAKIAAGALLPHEIVALANDRKEEVSEIAELQWKRLVQDMSAKGKLKNCIVVCNMGDGMEGKAMEVCTALGLLVSELSEEPWKGRVFTLDSIPQLHKIEGDTLKEKVSCVKTMGWGRHANVDAVFSRLLQVAVAAGLDKREMVKRVFLFGFDYAAEMGCYEEICRKFEECGYGDCVPEIVFWKLKELGSAVEAKSSRDGVALVSGFSMNMVKVFIERDGVLSPETIMEDAISGDEYQKLQVFD